MRINKGYFEASIARANLRTSQRGAAKSGTSALEGVTERAALELAASILQSGTVSLLALPAFAFRRLALLFSAERLVKAVEDHNELVLYPEMEIH